MASKARKRLGRLGEWQPLAGHFMPDNYPLFQPSLWISYLGHLDWGPITLLMSLRMVWHSSYGPTLTMRPGVRITNYAPRCDV